MGDVNDGDKDKDKDDDEGPVCRFCFEPARANDALVSPCACKGGQMYIHEQCLIRWQRMVVVSQPTHPMYYERDQRHSVCNVCKETFNTPPPTRLVLMSSFTGAEIAAMIDVGFILGSHETFSDTLERKFSEMSPELRRVCGYEHWIKGAFLITSVNRDDDDGDRAVLDSRWGVIRRPRTADNDAGEDVIVGVNLSGWHSMEEVVRGESRLFEAVDGDNDEEPTAGISIRIDGGNDEVAREVVGAWFEQAIDNMSEDDGDDEDQDQDQEEERDADEDESMSDADSDDDNDDDDDEEEEHSDDERRDPNADEQPQENENDEDHARIRRRRVPERQIAGHIRQLLSPFGPIYEVYKRYRRRRMIGSALKSAAERMKITVDDITNVITIDSHTGGPCDEDTISMCLVVGHNSAPGFITIPDPVDAITFAYAQYDARRTDGDIKVGSVVNIVARGPGEPKRSGVVIQEVDSSSDNWRIATADGVAEFPRDALEIEVPTKGGRVLAFWGTAQWTRAQLLGEIARGHWGLLKAEPRDVADAKTTYQRILDRGMAFAPLTEMTEEFMRDAMQTMNRIRSTGQIERAASPAI
mmetsp:Transcript_6092/g.20033  ORF Transcript_6092/g.20033 Transcript_6092/m.20033 type:complete len:584 (-) Transcript_6092:631-2382(-)